MERVVVSLQSLNFNHGFNYNQTNTVYFSHVLTQPVYYPSFPVSEVVSVLITSDKQETPLHV